MCSLLLLFLCIVHYLGLKATLTRSNARQGKLAFLIWARQPPRTMSRLVPAVMQSLAEVRSPLPGIVKSLFVTPLSMGMLFETSSPKLDLT